MQSSLMRRPSPGITVAALALVVALAGTAIAGPSTLTKPVTKRTVKKIASKQIKKLAPGLSVARAGDADALGGQPPSAYAASTNPPSREVGAPGEPLFQSGCQNYPGAWSTAGFYKDSMGIVHLKGLVLCPSADIQTAFTLPPGYRPSQQLLMPESASALESWILPGGEVQINCGGGACSHALDGFTFRAE